MHTIKQPSIKELAIIGDQKSCACIDKEGTIAWYCLWRFDQPSLFSLLIDEAGGYWSVEAEGKEFSHRQYVQNSTVLLTEFNVKGGALTVTDFMPHGENIAGICRLFSSSSVDITCIISTKPNYGRTSAKLKKDGDYIVRENRFEFYIKASHPLSITNNVVRMTIPAGESGWCALVDDERALPHIKFDNLVKALNTTISNWSRLMQQISYEGPYQQQMYQSYKAIQLVTHQQSGGILAAATTSLPEEIGGERNYDYRYVWLRDTAMNVSALVRCGSKGSEAERFLDFLCASRNTNKRNLFVPFYDLDYKVASNEALIPGTGYKNSKPIRIGNGAFDQLQLDAQANILLAAKQVYGQNKQKPHWQTILKTANYLAKHWLQKDFGIWEEHVKQHYTSSKVIVAKSLEFLAEHADDEKQKSTWINTAKEIRQFVSQHCMTSNGAYAVYAGSEAVDITSALFAVWWFDKPDSAAMKKTINRIEAEYRDGELYRRHLIQNNSNKEGVFLAGSLWMAQHYVMMKNLDKAKCIIDAVLAFSTDLGFLPEEGDVKTGEALGNLPQTFVHSSLMGVILDYKEALEKT